MSLDKAPSKRRRSESSESGDEDEDAQARILLLETEILDSKKKYNNIVDLIKIVQSGDHGDVAAISLCRVFTRLMVSGALIKKEKGTEKDAIVLRWLQERYSEYKKLLAALLCEEGFGPTALTLCMRLLKTEGQHLHNQEFKFPIAFLTDVIHELLDTKCEKGTRAEFGEKFLEEYDDVRYYTFEALGLVCVLNPKTCRLLILIDT